VKSNVGALGAMNKGAIPFNAETMQTNSLRLEQLSLMLGDYFATDTSGFDVDTAALDKIWGNQADFTDKISVLTAAANNLNNVARGVIQLSLNRLLDKCSKVAKVATTIRKKTKMTDISLLVSQMPINQINSNILLSMEG
jgi:cytochrome c556